MKRDRFYKSFSHRKKLFYVVSSLLLSIGLMWTGIIDLVLLLVLEKPDKTTHNAVTTVMVLHAVSFYLALFGFVHSFEARRHILSSLAIVAGGLSLVSLVVRITQELVLADFYPPDYAVT